MIDHAPYGKYFQNEGFISTTFDVESAKRFLDEGPQACCLKRITLLAGTRCLLLTGISWFRGEFEVLMGQKTLYLMRRNKDVKTYVNLKETHPAYCYDKAEKTSIITSDIVVVPNMKAIASP